MTYNVSMGTFNPTIPYYTILACLLSIKKSIYGQPQIHVLTHKMTLSLSKFYYAVADFNQTFVLYIGYIIYAF